MTIQQRLPKKYSSPGLFRRLKREIFSKAAMVVWRTRAYVETHPNILIALAAALRLFRPILIFRKVMVVTRYDDVTDVLNRDVDFTLAIYAVERMLAGSFILNIDWPRQHETESAVLRQALNKRGDPRRIQRIAEKRCQRAIDGAKAGGNEIEMVGRLSEPVVTDIAEQYFGIPVDARDGRDRLIEVLRDLASAILLLPPNGSQKRFQFEQSAQYLFVLTSDVVAARIKEVEDGYPASCKGVFGNDDVLSRLVQSHVKAKRSNRDSWLTEDWVRRMISGLVVFSHATVVRTSVDVIDELLKRSRKNAFDEAKYVARELVKLGRSAKKSGYGPDDLKQFVYEALRFRPMLPLLYRFSPRDTVIAYSKWRGRRVPAGALVVAPPIAAMFDRRVFTAPYRFRSNRPLWQYLVFGVGMHQCIGRHIADIELVEIAKQLLALPGLERAPERRGRIRYDGPAVLSLYLRFHNTGPAGRP